MKTVKDKIGTDVNEYRTVLVATQRQITSSVHIDLVSQIGIGFSLINVGKGGAIDAIGIFVITEDFADRFKIGNVQFFVVLKIGFPVFSLVLKQTTQGLSQLSVTSGD